MSFMQGHMGMQLSCSPLHPVIAKQVKPGSSAMQCGIKVGDEIISVDDVDTDKWDPAPLNIAWHA